MPNRLNQTELSLYSSQFASKIIEEFFKGKEFASGEDILNLTPVPQVNHTLIQKLYGQWKKDAQEFRSPYFDFTHQDVKEALDNFMNVVSRHIAVQKNDLNELLISATENTLTQLFEPLSYYTSKFNALPDLLVSTESVKEINRFNKLHKKALEQLANVITDQGSNSISAQQASDLLATILEDSSLSEAEETIVAQFSEVLPLGVAKLAEQAEATVQVPEVEQNSFFDYVQKSSEEQPKEPSTFDRPIIARPSNYATVSSQEPSKEEQSLNSTFKAKATEPGYNHPHIRIESIAGSIPLAQRFVYISQLFKGSADEFDQSIKMLDRCTSFSEAHEFIHKSLAHRYDWDTKSERVKELLATVRRKFN